MSPDLSPDRHELFRQEAGRKLDEYHKTIDHLIEGSTRERQRFRSLKRHIDDAARRDREHWGEFWPQWTSKAIERLRTRLDLDSLERLACDLIKDLRAMRLTPPDLADDEVALRADQLQEARGQMWSTLHESLTREYDELKGAIGTTGDFPFLNDNWGADFQSLELVPVITANSFVAESAPFEVFGTSKEEVTHRIESGNFSRLWDLGFNIKDMQYVIGSLEDATTSITVLSVQEQGIEDMRGGESTNPRQYLVTVRVDGVFADFDFIAEPDATITPHRATARLESSSVGYHRIYIDSTISGFVPWTEYGALSDEPLPYGMFYF